MIDATGQRSPKSENQPANEDVDEIAPGILRLMLPVFLPGLGHVNCYAIEDERGVALIDPGLPDGASHDALRQRLASVGLDIADVHTVVITHSHHDHYGGVARLAQLDTRHPLQVIAHRGFGSKWHDAYDDLDIGEDSTDLVERPLEEIEAIAARMVRPTPWGEVTPQIPAEPLRQYADGIGIRASMRPPEPTTIVTDADHVELGGVRYEIVHTPGHADDHICLWGEANGVFFSGDHVLPHITPHISGITAYEDPLGEFFRSLERMGEFDAASIVLPAHGDPFADLTGRAQAISEHHVERLDRVRAIGAEVGDADVAAYMRLLFRERSWGGMASSETFAHLEWLRLHDGAVRSEVDGRLRYDLGS